MNVIICDDEYVYRQSILEKVEAWSVHNHHEDAIMVKAFASGEDLLEAWQNGLPIDILFLDIEIPNELDGMNIAKEIYRHDENIPIVFVTNYSEYACEGYLVNALRYIIKPVQQPSINDCMNIAWNQWVLAQTESVRIDNGRQTIILPVRQIILIESYRHQIKITTSSTSSIEYRGSMSEIETKLPAGMFVQCHKSYIVNLMYVRKLQATCLTLANGEQIPLGRKYAAEFSKAFDLYYQGDIGL